MKNQVSAYILFFLACACGSRSPGNSNRPSNLQIPGIYVMQSSGSISVRSDTVYLNDILFSGYLYQLDSVSKDTISLEGYSNGLLNGIARIWFRNSRLMEQRTYLNGKKNGLQLAYWDNGNNRFEFTAVNDACEGELKEWNYKGALFHLAHFVNGQEDGVQKLWYDNGKIRANYVIVSGRRYGLLGTKNCKNVSDSIFVVR